MLLFKKLQKCDSPSIELVAYPIHSSTLKAETRKEVERINNISRQIK